MSDHEARAREIVEGHLPKMAYDSFLDGDYDHLISAISQALREAEEAERERAAKMAEASAEAHLARAEEAISETAQVAHDIAQAALFWLAASIRGEKDNG